MNKQIGKLNQKVIELLDLEYKSEIPIILGDSNIEHMKRQHPNDYERYGQDIQKNTNKSLKFNNDVCYNKLNI